MEDEHFKLAEYMQVHIAKKTFGKEIDAVQLVNQVLKDWKELVKGLKKKKG